MQRAIYVRNQQIDGVWALRIYSRICVLGADARPRKLGASDARLTPLETPRRRRGLKVAVIPSALTWTALTMRPSPVVAASSRPSVCVRCPRHENRLRGTRNDTKRCILLFREPAGAFSCAALGGFRVTGLADNRRLEWRATFYEGRWKTECQMRVSKYPIRPSSQNGDTTFQRRNAARQAAVVRGRAERSHRIGFA